MKAPQQQSNDSKFKEIIEPGIHKAVLYSIIDLGSHEVDMKEYGKKIQRKIRLQWELPEVVYVFNEEKGEQPAIVKRDINFSMHEKAALRKMISSWLGKPLTDKEATDFDMNSLLGKTCYVTIIHNGEYVNVDSITGIKKTDKSLVPVNDLRLFSLDEFDENVFNSLPEKTKEKIITTPEYKKIHDLPEENL